MEVKNPPKIFSATATECYHSTTCLVKFLDVVVLCSQGRINLSLMLCKWKNVYANYLQNLSPELFAFL